MARYIHAFHNVEINILDPNLQILLKRFMDKTKDAKLTEYWDDYKLSIDPSYKSESVKQQELEKAQPKKEVFYRASKVESAEIKVEATKESVQMYRGNKI